MWVTGIVAGKVIGSGGAWRHCAFVDRALPGQSLTKAMLNWFLSRRLYAQTALQPKVFSAAATKQSEFRRVLRHVTKNEMNREPAFLLKPADFQSALQPLAEKTDISQSIEPILKYLTSINLQSKSFINKFNLHQARAFFAASPNDTGSVEVQCGQVTAQMIWMGEHCAANRHDYKSQRKLIELVAKRRKLLRYLRTVSLERFYKLLDQLSLPPNYLESFENKYNFKYRK